MIKSNEDQEKNKNELLVTNEPISSQIEISDNYLRVNLSIGTITVYISIALLYIINNIIYENYHPDIGAIWAKVVPISIFPQEGFSPEPVERMQFQISMICCPIFIFIIFNRVNKLKKILQGSPVLSLYINIIGLIFFGIYAFIVFNENLLYVYTDSTSTQKLQTNSFFFKNNLIAQFNIVLCGILYPLIAWACFLNASKKENQHRKIIFNIISYAIVFFVILDVALYNVLHIAVLGWDRLMEINSAFYSVTQVFAGKFLLVNINCQYGLYAWFLCPLFKLIGLTTYKFALAMTFLVAVSFLLIYLGIRKIIKQDMLALIIFLALIFWQFWQVRIPFDSSYPRYYYQYWPIRILFPSIAFYLIVYYNTATQNIKRILLPILSLTSAFAILWNLDTGIVVYGAVFISLLYAALGSSMKDSLIRSLVCAAWMFGSLFFVMLLFVLSTRLYSGVWPDFGRFTYFQNIFYISGFNMLPMCAIHFWNFAVFVYLIACVYCVFNIRKINQRDAPILTFLFVLGFGLFAYFQGRSYDMTIDVVMYPAILILGIFCNKLFIGILTHKPGFDETVMLFFMSFIFLVDGACSMLYYTPSIHYFVLNNAFSVNTEKENFLKKRMDFITNNTHGKDTVLILARDYESYYYALGGYYNPVNIPSSTEIFLKSEVYAVLDIIKAGKYSIFYDATRPWVNADTVVKTLAKYTIIDKENDPGDFILLKPNKYSKTDSIVKDTSIVYYNNFGEFNKLLSSGSKLTLQEDFTVELTVSLDTTKLATDNMMFSDSSNITPYSGLLVAQSGADLTQYIFSYGNGIKWCGINCKLSCTVENHLVMKVQKNRMSVYNNNNLCGTINTDSAVKNSDGILFINPKFAGTVRALKISNK